MLEETHKLYNLTGKTAIVTGGGSGLGRVFCDVLAEFGADIVCPDIQKSRADETCEIIQKYGHRTLAIETDVSSYDSVRSMFEQVMDDFGRVDILVNNAGISARPGPVGEVDLEDWHNVINIDLHGVFYCMREGLRIMEKQQSGVIVNISSVLGFKVIPSTILSVPPYVAAKFAVVGLTKEAAGEYGKYGIRVNCIAPGFHHGTGLNTGGDAQPNQAKPAGTSPEALELTPLRRTASPQELKGLLLYLVSDSSGFVTGQVIAHDGGLSIW